MGALEFEANNYESAAVRFLDALDIKPDDEEAICNLALALKKTSYLEYAQIAFEEAVNVSPGNTFILQNYMLFLLEQKKFDQFNKVMTHAKRVMDKIELETVIKLFDEFKAAVDGTEGKVLPEDQRSDSASTELRTAASDMKTVKSALRSMFTKKPNFNAGGLDTI